MMAPTRYVRIDRTEYVRIDRTDTGTLHLTNVPTNSSEDDYAEDFPYAEEEDPKAVKQRKNNRHWGRVNKRKPPWQKRKAG